MDDDFKGNHIKGYFHASGSLRLPLQYKTATKQSKFHCSEVKVGMEWLYAPRGGGGGYWRTAGLAHFIPSMVQH